MKNLYFVDFCGTLIKIQTYPAFLEFLIRELHPIRKVLFWVLLQARLRLRSKKGIEFFALRYLSLASWQRLCAKFADQLVKEASTKVLDDINTLVDSRPVLLSGALVDYIEPTLGKLGLDWQIEGASLQHNGTRLTGFLASAFLFGDKKRTTADFLCDKEGVEINCCAAIGDSMYDFPLLESVGTAKVVRIADKELLEHARARGWDIIELI